MLLRLFTIAILLSPAFISNQDISGAAARIFGRPADPEIRKQAASSIESSTDKSNSKDAIEEALELANSAREATPPRYYDAEIAYRLAAKLSPRDPRPIIGLGNIWYDQKQYAAAAKMYQQALTMLSSGSGLGRHPALRGISAQQRRNTATMYANLGIVQLQTEDFVAAQRQFDQAIAGDAEYARWHALRGYSLMKQGKMDEARKALQEALRLEPENADYKTMLEQLPAGQP